MNLRIYLDALAFGERRKFARLIGVVPAYLSQIRSGIRTPSPQLALLIERATNGAVSRQDLRPDVYPEEFALLRQKPRADPVVEIESG